MSVSTISRLREQAIDGGVKTDEVTLIYHEEDDCYTLSIAGAEYHNLDEEALERRLSGYDEVLSEWTFWYETAPQGDWQWAFLRWVEDAGDRPPPERRVALEEGIQKIWGQLLLTVRRTDDGRTYELRHVDDADRGVDALTPYSDPGKVRELAKYDDDGSYRPLSTAPSLQAGWIFPALRPGAVVRAVDFFYPATIANWYREQIGTLDVTHWEEATERQTGIYAVTNELKGRAVDWVAEACCVDSQCLKRRKWDERPNRSLSVPRGDGPFPCREPCSLVIAAARKWALLEREEERSYTLRLTPSEKEQLEVLLEAVAEGKVADIREADVEKGANRYRARYLRAKRTDDRGRLVTAENPDD